METHYNNPNFVYNSNAELQFVDNSGLRLYYVKATRQYDSGVLTVGKCWSERRVKCSAKDRHVCSNCFETASKTIYYIFPCHTNKTTGVDPNWRHMIPPRQSRVVSEGHCFGACTKHTFDVDGIKVFAAMTKMSLIGREVKLRHVGLISFKWKPILVGSILCMHCRCELAKNWSQLCMKPITMPPTRIIEYLVRLLWSYLRMTLL